MGDCESMFPSLEGEENLIAAARIILRALETNMILTNDARKILADLGTQLSSMAKVTETKVVDEDLSDIEERLNLIHNKVMNWESEQSMIWECGAEEANEFLKVVEEARKLAENLESLNLSKDSRENLLLRKAHDVLQTAMARIEEEFRHILVHNKQTSQPEHLSFCSSEEDTVVDEGSIASFGDYSIDGFSFQRESMSKAAEDYVIDLVNPDVIPDLKCIANLMFVLNYGRECSQAFTSARKNALDDCLFILEVERSSIEVLKMEWATLNSKIRRWTRAMKIFVRVYLASERFLGNQIFGEELESVSASCFAESSKGPMLKLLNFAESIAVGPHQSEKLFLILDMYEVLADLIPEIEDLYSDESGSYVRTECQDVLNRLGDCVKATFLEFGTEVETNIFNSPFPGGGIHHLTRYVMNYIKTLTFYSESLNVLLKDHERENPISSSPDTSPGHEDDSIDESTCISAVSLHFRSLMSILECNLDEKSRLYRDDSLGHIFLMNNIHYMAEKVKGSELQAILGHDWIKKRNWKFQLHAMNYERASWSSILLLLRYEGLYPIGSNFISKSLLKKRMQSFYVAFEEIYKSQTAWSIPDTQLREDLRISVSVKVIQAYRTIVGRHINDIRDKDIKYKPDDLENYLLDLFEGSPRSLHSSSHRK